MEIINYLRNHDDDEKLDFEEFKKIVERNKNNINDYDDQGNTSLMIASLYGYRVGCVKVLIESGANINLQNKQGNTALILAVSEGSDFMSNKQNLKDIINLLIENGANLDIQNNRELTALMTATSYYSENITLLPGLCEILNMLLDAGANFTIQNKYGSSALTLGRNDLGIIQKIEDKYLKKIKILENEIKLLKEQIKYQPDGEGYFETKEHFDSLQKKFEN